MRFNYSMTLMIFCSLMLGHRFAYGIDLTKNVHCQESSIQDTLPLKRSNVKMIENLDLHTRSQMVRTKTAGVIPPPPPAPTLQPSQELGFFDRLKNKLRNWATVSRRRCAQGVRNILNTLFNKNISSGPPAKKYDQKFLANWRTGNSCYKQASDDGDFKNYDIRVLQPRNPREAGHIEIYVDGNWYSDFKQRMSLWNGGNSKYSKKSFYRFSNCSTAALEKSLFNLLAQILLTDAEALEAEINDDQTPFPSHTEILAVSKNWTIKEIYRDQGTDFVLFKDNKKVSLDSNSVYSLIYDIKDKNLQITLAEDALNKWISKVGRKEVQKTILEFDSFTELQKETYVKFGFLIPKKFTIYPK